MRLVAVTLMAIALNAVAATSAQADAFGCGGPQPVGTLTCTTTGPAMINSFTFAGDGGSSAQLQWVGSTVVTEPGTLTLTYTYTGIYNTLFSKIGMRLTVHQPTCEEPAESLRVWIDPATMDGIPGQVTVPVSCPGAVGYTITSRAATYSLGGSFIGTLTHVAVDFASRNSRVTVVARIRP